MSTSALAELTRLLEEQVQVYRALNELAERKEQALRLAEIETLDRLLKVEQALVFEGGELERRRFEAQKKLAAAWGVPVEEVVLSTVTARADEITAARCRAAGEELGALLSTLKERNARCASIIAGALDLVKKTLERTAGGLNLVDRRV
ncbi:MAG: hypothetical protein PWP58_1543 [Bacillota bacterium]|jgi:flagellar biosynthesis/type III secretory pathway chaperone|nr:hypothetical protein [Bacillota bacterium]